MSALQVYVIVAIATAVAFVAGMIFGGRARDDLDECNAGRDIAGEARAGKIERRRVSRAALQEAGFSTKTQPVQPVDFERPRT